LVGAAAPPRPALEKYAEQLGLDMPKFKKALDTNAHKGAVDADSKVADEAGVSGTPAFIVTVNGKPEGYFISGAQPFPKFKKVIDRALKEAKLDLPRPSAGVSPGGRQPGNKPTAGAHKAPAVGLFGSARGNRARAGREHHGRRPVRCERGERS
jgi:hypothetical protein